MALRIEDYALIGDTQAAALVGRDGSIDWMCLPRFDSGACFAALLGEPQHGRWSIAPVGRVLRTRRRYRSESLVLETELSTAEGTLRLTDCMPIRGRAPDVVRVAECIKGRVPVRMELVVRFDYGSVVPWARRLPDGRLGFVAGPDALVLSSTVPHHGHDRTTVSEFALDEGERAEFVLTWHPSHERAPHQKPALDEVQLTEHWWGEWARRCHYEGPFREPVVTSLMVLKALTFEPTGGIVAAPTTSLPEWLGGVRNWDYRFCWLRDATFTLQALMTGGHQEEARAWRDWLLRAVAGDPSKLQIMYGVAGERRLAEHELGWLTGYAGSTPVRVGNAAVDQLQLDVYGEVMDAMHQSRRAGLPPDEDNWALQRALLDYLESGAWRQPDEGLWEVRGGRQHFTHSKVMCWVAFDRAIKTVEQFGREGPLERWRAVRDGLHREVCERAWSADKRAFVQAYGSDRLDASLLLLPQVGFLPTQDPRVRSTVEAIERELVHHGLVRRYLADERSPDALPPGEGPFLACSFWLADALSLVGREADAHALYERLLALRNDVGLLSEEYDPVAGRMLGNFPQAFSHVGVINTGFNLTPDHRAPMEERCERRRAR